MKHMKKKFNKEGEREATGTTPRGATVMSKCGGEMGHKEVEQSVYCEVRWDWRLEDGEGQPDVSSLCCHQRPR